MNTTAAPQRLECNVSSGKDAWKNQLLKEFPDERKAIEQFFALMKRANRPFGYSLGIFAFKILPLWLVKSDVLLGFAVSSERLFCIKQTLNRRSCHGNPANDVQSAV